jgi:hypothetical protein
MSILNNSALLRLNRDEQVNAFNALGFDVNENTPLSAFADYMKWAGGKLPSRIAVYCITEFSLNSISYSKGCLYYFSKEEWANLGSNAWKNLVTIGLEIRAEKRRFIMSSINAVDSKNSTSIAWGGYGKAISGVTSYNSSASVWDVFSGAEDTLKIISSLSGYTDSQGIVGSPAASICANYRATTLNAEPVIWYLPSIGELRLMCKYKDSINAELASFGFSTFIEDWYWSSTPYDNSSCWYVNMGSGYSYYSYRYNTGRVRPVCLPVVLAG